MRRRFIWRSENSFGLELLSYDHMNFPPTADLYMIKYSSLLTFGLLIFTWLNINLDLGLYFARAQSKVLSSARWLLIILSQAHGSVAVLVALFRHKATKLLILDSIASSNYYNSKVSGVSFELGLEALHYFLVIALTQSGMVAENNQVTFSSGV